MCAIHFTARAEMVAESLLEVLERATQGHVVDQSTLVAGRGEENLHRKYNSLTAVRIRYLFCDLLHTFL